MSTIIAFDTSSDVATVSLLCGDEMLSASSTGFSSHSLTVLPMLQDLLQKKGRTAADCDAVAFGCGPGSFTGIRTACGIALGISFARKLPVIPVVTLLAMAETCRVKTGKTDVVSLLDARMHEIYWAQYRFTGGEWTTVTGPSLTNAADITPDGSPAFCGNALKAYAEELKHLTEGRPCFPEIYPHADAVARLAKVRFEHGETVPADKVQPLYLRNKVALKTSERQELGGKGA